MRKVKLKRSRVSALLVFVWLILASCFSNNPSQQNGVLNLTEDELKSLALLESPIISEEEAKQTLLGWLTNLQEENQKNIQGLQKTSLTLPEIESVKTLSANKSYLSKTTGVSHDTIPPAYLVNFKDNQGFALTSADRRVVNGGVIAYVPQGKLQVGDTLEPGLDFYFSHIEKFIENEKVKYKKREEHLESALMKLIETLPDSVKNKFTKDTLNILKKEAIINQWTTIVDSIVREIGWTYFEGKGNLLLRVAHRQQERIRNYRTPFLDVTCDKSGPYNDNAPNLNCFGKVGGRPPIGCVATATAQIMSYYEEPKHINTATLNWLDMKISPSGRKVNNQGKSHIAMLFRWIADEVGMSYGCDASGAHTQNAVNFLQRQGYSLEGGQGYNWSKIVESINDEKPVLVEGYTDRKRSCFLFWCSKWVGSGSGHAWVVDGYMTRWTRTQVSLEYFDESRQVIDHSVNNRHSNYNVVDHYVHVNWGWGGSKNGYFYDGVFNSKDTVVSQVNGNTLRKQNPSHYDSELKIWTHISH